jgi:glycosyl hydrolase family 16
VRAYSGRVTTVFLDDFEGVELDFDVWLPHYLPQWSSRRESAATFAVERSRLRLTIPTGQGLWCAADHEPPLRVSGVQSGVFSGAAGSTVGQQPFRDGLVVREEQPAHWGWTPHFGRIEVRARMELSPSSMASVWLVGLEDVPERSGEICLFEVFGDSIKDGPDGPVAAIGQGVHPFRDPALTDDFAAAPRALDVRDFHVYAADWGPRAVSFVIDSECVQRVSQAPDYPMQLEIAVFDFPDRSSAAPSDHVPLLEVDWIRGTPPP